MIDLFSGIGGFSLAASYVFPDHETVAFVENNLFCQKVLRKNFGEDINIFGDIKDFDGKIYKQQIDIVTGGFPCQPFSIAGERKGQEDNRFLWKEMLRVIQEVGPYWAIVENVAGIIDMELDNLCADLENEGYSTQSFIIPACSKNAPHRRDRVWLIAFKDTNRIRNRGWSNGNKTGVQRPLQTKGPNSHATNTGNEGLQGSQWAGAYETGPASFRPIAECNNSWNRPWIEVATSLCRIPHGLSEWMDENWRRINGTTSKVISRQEVSDMWDYFQSDEIQRNIRGQFPLLKKNDLLTVLCKLKAESDTQDSIPFEGKAIQKGYLRELSNRDGIGCSPQGREYQKQQCGQHNDALPSLPHEIALAAESIIRWHKLETDNPNRVDRIKALGNSVVPQILVPIFKCIKEIGGY